jgi:hypothetical protein
MDFATAMNLAFHAPGIPRPQLFVVHNGEWIDLMEEESVNADRKYCLLVNAVDQYDARAQYHLGLMYGNGEGVSLDKNEAVRLVQLAAAQEFEPARGLLTQLQDATLMPSSMEYTVEELVGVFPRWAREAAADSDVYTHPTLPLTARNQTTLEVVNDETGERTATLSGRTSCICWHPLLPNIIATGSDDPLGSCPVTRVLDIGSGQCTVTLIGHTGRRDDTSVRCIDWHPSLPAIIATGGDDRTAKVWDTTTGQCTVTLDVHFDPVGTLKWHPTSQNILATGSYMSAKVWDTASGECIAALEGHLSYVTSVGWHPLLPNVLATAGYEDNTVKLWDTTSRECIATLREEEEWRRNTVSTVDWHPTNPNILATGEGYLQGTEQVRLWTITGLFNPFWSMKLHCTMTLSTSPMLRSAGKFVHFVVIVGGAMCREIEFEGNVDDGDSSGGSEIAYTKDFHKAEPIPPEIWLYILTFLKVGELHFRNE